MNNLRNFLVGVTLIVIALVIGVAVWMYQPTVPTYRLALGEGYGPAIPHGTTQARLETPAGYDFSQWVQIPHSAKEWNAHPHGDVEYLHPDGTTAQDSPVGGTVRTREGSEPYYGLRIRSLTGQATVVDLTIHY
jgi:hypothetical protein